MDSSTGEITHYLKIMVLIFLVLIFAKLVLYMLGIPLVVPYIDPVLNTFVIFILNVYNDVVDVFQQL